MLGRVWSLVYVPGCIQTFSDVFNDVAAAAAVLVVGMNGQKL